MSSQSTSSLRWRNSCPETVNSHSRFSLADRSSHCSTPTAPTTPSTGQSVLQWSPAGNLTPVDANASLSTAKWSTHYVDGVSTETEHGTGHEGPTHTRLLPSPVTSAMRAHVRPPIAPSLALRPLSSHLGNASERTKRTSRHASYIHLPRFDDLRRLSSHIPRCMYTPPGHFPIPSSGPISSIRPFIASPPFTPIVSTPASPSSMTVADPPPSTPTGKRRYYREEDKLSIILDFVYDEMGWTVGDLLHGMFQYGKCDPVRRNETQWRQAEHAIDPKNGLHASWKRRKNDHPDEPTVLHWEDIGAATNYLLQRDPALGRVNAMNIGIAATYIEAPDCPAQALDFDDKQRRLAENARSSLTVTQLVGFIDQRHVETQGGQEPERYNRQLVLFCGDGLTFEKIVLLKHYLRFHHDPFKSFAIIEPILAPWHTVWTDIGRIFETYWGSFRESWRPTNQGTYNGKLHIPSPLILNTEIH
ncbi:hypothetical protein C8Q76DRAFT_781188 [Earliella scabrosa]|nr:hypothetical protein C8Q76DRAFT_781188 [Earliella scabrosa]